MGRIEIVFKSRIVCCAFALLGLAVLFSGCATELQEPREEAIHQEALEAIEEAAGATLKEATLPTKSHLWDTLYGADEASGKTLKKATLPKSHLWDTLYGADEEPPGYAMYTYVLINQSKANSAAWNRYEKLVKSITLSISSVANHGPGFNRSLYNLFLIPHKYGGHQHAESLNDILSKSILTSIAASVQKQKLRELINTNPGPFLISAAEPISNEKLNKDIEMLYVDLTRTNLDAMPEVVAAYKKRLTSDSIEGLERFNSIKLSLLNLILDADDYISMVKVAYAGWIKD